STKHEAMAGRGGYPGAGVFDWTARGVASTRRCRRLPTFYFTERFLLHLDWPSRVASARWRCCPGARASKGHQRSLDRFKLRTAETVCPLLACNGRTVDLSLFAVVIVIDLEN